MNLCDRCSKNEKCVLCYRGETMCPYFEEKKTENKDRVHYKAKVIIKNKADSLKTEKKMPRLIAENCKTAGSICNHFTCFNLVCSECAIDDLIKKAGL